MSDKKEMPHFTLEVVKWEGKLHCCYLNNFRIAGSKPWAGGETVKSWPVPLRDLVQAIPELRKTSEERDTALSQLAALREELAKVTGERDRLRNGLESDMAEIDRIQSVYDAKFVQCRKLRVSLADAERRNAPLETLLKECVDCVRYGEDFDLPVTTMARIDAALNPKPEAASHDFSIIGIEKMPPMEYDEP